MHMQERILFSDRVTKECWLIGLLVRCPIAGSEANPEACPLYKERQETFSKQLVYVQGLSDIELHKILLQHFNCKNNHS